MSLVQNWLVGGGLYIFDEPEAALSPTRQMSLLIEIDRIAAENSQFIISTHSPILMAYPDAEIYEIKDDAIKPTAYQDTEHYQVTKQFLNNPEKMLRLLLE
jgi:predicted ATPase